MLLWYLDKISKIIFLESIKARGQDMIIICMLKLCDSSICKPLEIVFKFFLAKSIFSSSWKRINIVPIHSKDNI